MNRYTQRLACLAQAYRRAEARIVSAYFAKPRNKRDHLRWLRAQGFKEYAAIKPILAALTKLYKDVDRGLDRHDYAELTEKLADEMKHATLVMNLLDEIWGRKVNPSDLTWLPEDKKLARVRARYSKSLAGLLHGSESITAKNIRRQDEDLERAVITLTEGGGGALYEVCRHLKRNGLERKISRAFATIHRDELRHKNAGGRELGRLIKTRESCDRAAKILCEISAQRLRMRNEQLGFPLNEKEMTALDERARRWETKEK